METVASTPVPARLVSPAAAPPSVPQALDAPRPAPVDPERLPGMFDLVLRGQWRLDELVCSEEALPKVVPRLLALSALGLALHGLVVGTAAMLLDGPFLGFYQAGLPVVWMPVAFPIAFLLALSVCLPSFYFYTQLSGLDASFRLVTAQALRVQATTSVLLLGVLPFYAAWALGTGLETFGGSAHTVLFAGFALPFLVGLAGIRALHRSFGWLAQHLPRTHARRGRFLQRLVLAWGAVYSAVAPVALYRLAEHLPSLL